MCPVARCDVVLRVIGRQGAAVLVRVVGIILASLAVDVSSRPICPIFEVWSQKTGQLGRELTQIVGNLMLLPGRGSIDSASPKASPLRAFIPAGNRVQRARAVSLATYFCPIFDFWKRENGTISVANIQKPLSGK
jgi:hypothetical protein